MYSGMAKFGIVLHRLCKIRARNECNNKILWLKRHCLFEANQFSVFIVNVESKMTKNHRQYSYSFHDCKPLSYAVAVSGAERDVLEWMLESASAKPKRVSI